MLGTSFCPVQYGSKFEDYYLPSTLIPNALSKTPADRGGGGAPTIAVPTILTAYNWRLTWIGICVVLLV